MHYKACVIKHYTRLAYNASYDNCKSGDDKNKSLHCPKCTNLLEENVILVDVGNINSRTWWKCMVCKELYAITQLKDSLASP